MNLKPIACPRWLACCALIGAGLAVSPPTARAQDEYRAFWVDAFGSGFKNSAQVTTLMTDIRAAHANMVLPEVRKRGDAYYSGSIYEPKATDISPSTFDPLQDLITKAHDTTGGKQRVEVHAWIVSYKIWGDQLNPPPASNPPHPYNAHPDWLTRDATGATWDGSSYSFDPAHPEAQRYTYNVCMDIISRYDIDGFNFDYIRYTGNDWGYHPVAVARFNARFGRTGQPATTDPLWLQFRRDQVTSLVRKVYLNAIAIKPNIKISADTITWGASGVANDSQWYSSSSAYTDVLQDWRGWMQEGILDLNIPMNYYREHQYPAAYVNWMNFAKDHKFNRQVIIGPGIYLNYTSNAISQMRAVRNTSPGGNAAEGVCGYVYKQPDAVGTSFATFRGYLTNSPNAADPSATPIFPAPVNVPAMAWKSAPTKGHAKGFVYGNGTTNPLDGAVVTISSSPSRTQTNDATGFYGYVDLNPGTYTITATYPGYNSASTNVTVTAGAVATRDLVLILQGPPAVAAEPQDQTVYQGAQASFTVTASGSLPFSYQWRRAGTNLPGADSQTLVLGTVSTNDAGGYSVVVSNSFGAITSRVATLTVLVPAPTTRLLPLWDLAPGERPYLTSGTTERGLAHNPVNNRLVVVSRASGNGVFVLDAATGADLHTLSNGSGIISGGTFPVNLVGVADDGAIYVCNLTTDTTAGNLKIYRWANDQPGTTPTVAYNGAPAAGRWGDSMDVRGAGANTQIIMASRNGPELALFRTANGTTFTPTVMNLADGSVGLGLAFAEGNSVWGKANGTTLRKVAFSLSPATAASVITNALSVVPSAVGAVGVSTQYNVLAGVAVETPDNLKLYDILPSFAVSLVATNPFATDNPNSNNTGAVDFAGDRVYALCTGNGIVAMKTSPAATTPSIETQPASLTRKQWQEAGFAVAAKGTEPLYPQWYFNNAAIPGATGFTYVIPAIQPANQGTYRVIITNVAGSITSQPAALAVVPIVPPQLTTIDPGPAGIQLTGTGDPGTYTIEMSSNLVAWIVRTSFPSLSGGFSWVDPVTNPSPRLYRAVWTP